MDSDKVVNEALSIDGLTTESELKFLYRLALEPSAGSQIVELGTFHGRSLLVLAHAARLKNIKLFSLDNYSYYKKCSLERTRNNLVERGFGKELDSSLIVLLERDSTDKPSEIEDVGLLFIDSKHTKEHFDTEMKVWLSSVPVGGIIACHDYDRFKPIEITRAIDGWFNNGKYQKIDHVRRMVGFRRL